MDKSGGHLGSQRDRLTSPITVVEGASDGESASVDVVKNRNETKHGLKTSPTASFLPPHCNMVLTGLYATSARSHTPLSRLPCQFSSVLCLVLRSSRHACSLRSLCTEDTRCRGVSPWVNSLSPAVADNVRGISTAGLWWPRARRRRAKTRLNRPCPWDQPSSTKLR